MGQYPFWETTCWISKGLTSFSRINCTSASGRPDKSLSPVGGSCTGGSGRGVSSKSASSGSCTAGGTAAETGRVWVRL